MPRQCCKQFFNKLSDNIPVFTIVGYDQLAIETIEFWLTKAKKAGVNQFKIDVTTAHLEDIKRFQEENPGMVKKPD